MDLVRIVPNSFEGGPVPTQGTKVYCGDQKIHNVVGATVHFDLDDVVRVDLRLHGWMASVEAVPRFQMRHPITNELVTVDKIIFEGGDELDLCG